MTENFPSSTATPQALYDHGNGIYAIDAQYVAPQVAAIHLIVHNGAAAFFDCGTNYSLPHALTALGQLGLGVDAVRYVIPSHVHLDHAGGAGAMMAAFPNAQLVVHPRGARHMADPSKLVAGASEVYGPAVVQKLYGELLPIPVARIVEATDGMTLDLNGRTLTVLDTPGHAKHHICLVDGLTGEIFTGDMFGLSYRHLEADGRPSIIPTTTPVQFDPVAMRASIQRLLDLKPAAMYPTHFSKVGDIPRLGESLLRQLDLHLTFADEAKALPKAERHAFLSDRISKLFLAERVTHGWPLSEAQVLKLLATDIDLNAQGLEVWLDSQV